MDNNLLGKGVLWGRLLQANAFSSSPSFYPHFPILQQLKAKTTFASYVGVSEAH